MSEYMDYLARRIGYTSYEGYLRSEHWRLFSAGMRRSRCLVCRSQRSLQVHHTTYERLGAELPTDVITVCDACHKAIHNLAKEGAPLGQAHRSLMKGRKPERHGRSRKTWTHWKELCNYSLKESPRQVADFLIAEGYAKPGPYGGLVPMLRALRRRLAKPIKRKPGRYSWNKTRYLSLTRDARRQKSASNSLP